MLIKTGGRPQMRRQHTLRTLGTVFGSLLLIAPVTCFAQKRPDTPGGVGTSARRDSILAREADLEGREIRLRLLSEPGKTKTAQTVDERKFIVNQIFEDFERMQVVNREMMQASSNLNAQSCKRISSLADEMTKRAKRLKTNLGIPDPEPEKNDHEENAPAMDVAQFKASLQTLDGSVKSFVNSPLFKDPRVTTVGQLHSLRKDITNVIELSRTVKKAAGKLYH
jgi:hypothetical protein